MSDSLDFALNEDQAALRDLAAKILEDLVTHERLTEIEATDDWFDRRAWQALADAGLLGIGLPEAYGGGGLGFLETCVVLEEIGRTVAPVPIVPTTVAAHTIAEFGDDAQRSRWLPEAAGGGAVLTLALQEPNNDDPTSPTTRADVGRDGWRLVGAQHCVQAAHLAARMLVPARTGVGIGLFLVDPKADGVTLTRAGRDERRTRLPRRPRRRVGRTARRSGRRHPHHHVDRAACARRAVRRPGRGERAGASDDGRVHVHA